MKKEEFEKQHPYVIKIPEGYQYCPDCQLITPHSLKEEKRGAKFTDVEDYECDLCSHSVFSSAYCCPNCGWEHDPEDVYPTVIKDKVHTQECLDNQQKAALELEINFSYGRYNVDTYECTCPEVDCYPVQKIYNYHSYPGNTFECMNAREWSYNIMCEICNYVFEIEDGNC